MPQAPANPAGPAARPPSLVFELGILGAAFVFSLIVLGIGYIHNQPELGLVSLVVKQTTRETTIVVNRESDPGLAAIAERLPELFDRHLVVVNGAGAVGLQAAAPFVILTAASPPPDRILAQTGNSENASPGVKKILRWYSQNIARRHPGDKLEIGDKYFLCRPSD